MEKNRPRDQRIGETGMEQVESQLLLLIQKQDDLGRSLRDQGEKLDKVVAELANIGRLDERLTAHNRESERMEKDLGRLWTEHRSLDMRIQTLERQNGMSTSRWEIISAVFSRVVTPLLLTILVGLASFWVATHHKAEQGEQYVKPH